MTVKRISLIVSDEVLSDLRSFKRDKRLLTDASAFMSLFFRGLYSWHLEKCNTNPQAGSSN